MTCTTVSGGSDSANCVDPRRSTNMHVPTTRTPPSRSSPLCLREHLVDDLLGHEARECVARALPIERGEHVVHGERADGRDGERDHRVHEREDRPVVERELRPDGVERRRAGSR